MNGPSQSAGWAAVDEDAHPESYGAFLRGYRADGAVRRHRARCLEILQARPGERILDIGCGAGDDVRALATRIGRGGRVIGIDRSRELIRLARECAEVEDRAAEIRFVVGDAQELPFRDGSADACWIERVIQHLADPPIAIREAVRVLRPGGRILVTEPDWATLKLEVPGGRRDVAEVSRALACHIAEDVRSPRIGAELVRLFGEAGVPATEVLDLCVKVGDAATADALLSLRRRLLELCALGAFDEDAARDWLDALRDAGAAGTFALELRVVTFLGRRPAGA